MTMFPRPDGTSRSAVVVRLQARHPAWSPRIAAAIVAIALLGPAVATPAQAEDGPAPAGNSAETSTAGPSIAVPPSVTATEDVASAIMAISVDGVDILATVTLRFSVSSGTLSAVSGAGVTVGGTSSNLSLTGTAAAINAFIAQRNLSFTTAANATASVTLAITLTDGASTLATANTVIETSPPAVASVGTTHANGSYKAGDSLVITVTFNQPVIVDTTGGIPALLLETGILDRSATLMGGSGNATLTFSYTVQAGDTSADLDYASTTALSLNGGAITSSWGTTASLTLPSPGTAGSLAASHAIVIDGIAPTAPINLRLSPASDSGDSNADGITNNTTPTITGIAEAGSTVTVRAGASSSLHGVTVADANGNWTFTLFDLPDGRHEFTAQATDAAGNVSALSDSLVVVIDTTAPAALTLSNAQVRTTDGANATVGVLTATDASDTLRFELAPGTGDTDNALFVVAGAQVRLVDPAIAGAGSRSVRVTATDQAGNVAGQAFAISVVENQAPEITGVPAPRIWLTAGVSTPLPAPVIAETDGDEVTVRLSPTGGTVGGIIVTPGVTSSVAGDIWTLTGSAHDVTAALAQVSFTASNPGVASLALAVDDGQLTEPVTATYLLYAAPAAAISTQPGDALRVVPGGSATFTVAASDPTAIESIRWEVSSGPGTVWQVVPGEHDSSLTVAVTPSSADSWYRAVLTGRDGVVTASDAARLTVWDIPVEAGRDHAELAARYPNATSLTALSPDLDLAALPAIVTLTLPWAAPDSAVTVYGYSTPAYVGTFAVTDGSVALNNLALQAGEHYLVVVGVDSKTIQVLHYDTADGSTPAPTPTSTGTTAAAPSATSATPTASATAASAQATANATATSGLAATGAQVSAVLQIAGVLLLLGGTLMALCMRPRAQTPRR